MEFDAFVSAFGTGYRSIRNERRIEGGESEYHNKASFCRELLCQITKDESIVLFKGADPNGFPRTLPTFESFYRNNQRRSIRPIARCMLERNAIDKAKFKRFLKLYTGEFSKDILFQNFQPYLSNTTLKTLLNGITDEYVRIIRAAANEPDRRQGDTDSVSSDLKDKEAENGCLVHNPAEVVAASTEPVSVPSNQCVIEVEDSDMKHNPIHEVDALLNKLIKVGRMVADYEKEKAVGQFKILKSPFRSKLQSEFKRLRLLADALLTSEESQTASALDQIAQLIFELTAESFVLSEFEYRIITPQNEQLHQLLNLVEGLKTESASQQ